MVTERGPLDAVDAVPVAWLARWPGWPARKTRTPHPSKRGGKRETSQHPHTHGTRDTGQGTPHTTDHKQTRQPAKPGGKGAQGWSYALGGQNWCPKTGVPQN